MTLDLQVSFPSNFWNVFDVALAGTAPQLNAMNPNWFDDGQVRVTFVSNVWGSERLPTGQYNSRVISDGHGFTNSGGSRGPYPSF